MARYRKNVALFIFLFSLFILVPYGLAYLNQGNQLHFMGFLLNVKDGNSYLAKMMQGWEGNWRFVLPFTSEPGKGGYLFLFYLFLGHVSRVLNVTPIFIFHLSRVFCSIFLLITISEFYLKFFLENTKPAFRAFILTAIGSGAGWIALPFGQITSDFWVAEAYPFLSCFLNPHFPLGIALMLWLFILIEQIKLLKIKILILICAFMLSIIMPFGVVVMGFVLGVNVLTQWISRGGLNYREILYPVLGGLPFLIYQYWISITDPVLALWNSQNITYTPPIWDIVISFFPPIVFCILGIVRLLRSKGLTHIERIVIIWFITAVLLIYVPFGLQRRFILGLYIPIAALANYGLEITIQRFPRRNSLLIFRFILSSVISNIVLMISISGAIKTQNPDLYLSKSEFAGLEWIDDNTEKNDIILASPAISLYIPGTTGRKVLYGHPFETINANVELDRVVSWYKGSMNFEDAQEFLAQRYIKFIFFGPREHALGDPEYMDGYDRVYKNADVEVFRTR